MVTGGSKKSLSLAEDVAHHGPFDGPFSFFPGMAMTIAGEALSGAIGC